MYNDYSVSRFLTTIVVSPPQVAGSQASRALCTLYSTPHSVLYTSLCTLHLTLHSTPHSALCNLIWTLHLTMHSVTYSAFYTSLCTLHRVGTVLIVAQSISDIKILQFLLIDGQKRVLWTALLFLLHHLPLLLLASLCRKEGGESCSNKGRSFTVIGVGGQVDPSLCSITDFPTKFQETSSLSSIFSFSFPLFHQ